MQNQKNWVDGFAECNFLMQNLDQVYTRYFSLSIEYTQSQNLTFKDYDDKLYSICQRMFILNPSLKPSFQRTGEVAESNIQVHYPEQSGAITEVMQDLYCCSCFVECFYSAFSTVQWNASTVMCRVFFFLNQSSCAFSCQHIKMQKLPDYRKIP